MKDDRTRDRFLQELKRKRDLAERRRREEEPSFWNYLGLMGAVGWTVALPLALGVIIGRWIDGRFDTGVAWTVFLMLVGLGLGCFNTWRLLREKS